MRTGFGGGLEVVDLKLVTPNRLLSILVEVGHQLCCYIAGLALVVRRWRCSL
jgi:hypothetical protein